MMRRAIIPLILILNLMTKWSYCEDSDFFSSNENLLSFNEVEPDFSSDDDLFTNEIGFNTGDNFFVDDDEDDGFLNAESSLPIESVPTDLLATDRNPPNCFSLSLSSLSRRQIRARSSAVCPAQSGSSGSSGSNVVPPETYLNVRTDEDVQKYWCSESDHTGFSNIPVCNLIPVPGVASDILLGSDLQDVVLPKGYLTLVLVQISKFSFFLFSLFSPFFLCNFLFF